MAPGAGRQNAGSGPREVEEVALLPPRRQRFEGFPVGLILTQALRILSRTSDQGAPASGSER
jgi:hypothetical protein